METSYGPSTTKGIKVIENVQKRGRKLVLELKDLDYEHRLKYLGIPNLVYLRFRGDMIGIYKYILAYYDVQPVLKKETHLKTRGHKGKIRKSTLFLSIHSKFSAF